MGQGKIILVGTLVLLIGIALGAISGIEIDAEGLELNWNSISSLLTGLAGVATAIAAWTAVMVYNHQRDRDEAMATDGRSKFYLDECLQTARNATQILRDGNRSPESFISAGLLLGEVTQLEHNIVNSEHRRLYRLHRQYEIDQTKYIFIGMSDNDLRGSVFNNIGEDDSIVLGCIERDKESVALKDTLFYTEGLLEEQEFITPFPGVPLGRLLCIYRFFINDPHYIKPDDRLTDRELNELMNFKPIYAVRRHIENCLLFDVKNSAIVVREESIKLDSLHMNYDMVITRNYVV
jgi:hypothetical protein